MGAFASSGGAQVSKGMLIIVCIILGKFGISKPETRKCGYGNLFVLDLLFRAEGR